ncbi:MAG TPA: hypothetical protein PKC91_06665 [Ignavibacteria bacterium]|mgnify:CR=1 FL=1|nr:hypothetical protein [Ignavibacteria bacterium]
MKILLLHAFLLAASISFAQGAEVNLDGNIFKGTASEITPSDADRMPVVFRETIIFSDGKIDSELMKIYSAGKCSYTAVTDDRRMIAMKVVNVQFISDGFTDGKNVTLKFNGNLIGENMLSGNLTVLYPDNSEVIFSVIAEKK